MKSGIKKPEFLAFFLAQGLSLFGRWVQATAQRWLLYELTSSTTYLGLLGATGSVPMLLLSIPAGVVTDRISRKKVFVASQLFGAACAAALGALTFFDLVRPWHILAVAFLLGMGVALEFPVRNTLIYEIVGKEDLVSAISLHSFAFNLSRFLGPAFAGWLMTAYGFSSCFFLNALSFLPVSLVVLSIRLNGKNGPSSNAKEGLFSSLKEGLFFVHKTPEVREVLVLVAGISLGVFPYAILLPAFAGEVFGGGAGTFTTMMVANGLGALLGAAFVTLFGKRLPKEKVIRASVLGISLSVFLLSLVEVFTLALGLVFLAGLFGVTTVTNANARVQSLCPDEVRGRVMGLFSWCFLGLLPAGSLVLGTAASYLGIRTTLGTSSLLVILGLGLFLVRKRT